MAEATRSGLYHRGGDRAGQGLEEQAGGLDVHRRLVLLGFDEAKRHQGAVLGDLGGLDGRLSTISRRTAMCSYLLGGGG